VIFQRTFPNTHYRSLRLVSTGGAWELGFSLYASGMRLRMGRVGRPPSVLDFCLGQDEEIFLPVLAAVMKRLEPVMEMAMITEIDAAFPWKGTRPDLAMHLDLLLSVA
jgi:hypothetical protein